MAVLVRMTEWCSMASSLSCAPARRGAICRRYGRHTTTYNHFNLWAKKGHLATHVRDPGRQLATTVAADRQLESALTNTPGAAKKGVRTAPSAVLVEDRAPRPMPRSIRQGSRYASCSRKATLSTDHAQVLIVQLEPSRDSSPNVAMTRAPVSIWSLAAATISHLDLSRPNLS